MVTIFPSNPGAILSGLRSSVHKSANEIEIRVRNATRIHYSYLMDFLTKVDIGEDEETKAKRVKKTSDKVTVYNLDDNKTVQYRSIQAENGVIKFQRKTTLTKDDAILYDYGLRLTYAREDDLDSLPKFGNNSVRTIRKRDRTTFTFAKGFHFDLTMVTMDDVVKYEIEVEFDNQKYLRKYINHVVAWLQHGSIAPMNSSAIVRYLNQKLFEKDKYEISTRDIVQASDLRFDHLSWGRIIGPDTRYYATNKIDGSRCLLINLQNCWFIFQVPNILKLIQITPGEDKPLSVFDCELYLDSKGRATIFPFDCLIDSNVVQTAERYTTRLETLTRKLKEGVIPATIQQYRIVAKDILLLDTPEKFRENVGKLLAVSRKFRYPTDGIIFTRDANYNNYTNVPGFRNMPDVLKWKPKVSLTIDLQYSAPNGSSSGRYYVVGDDAKPSEFTGSNMLPFRNPPPEFIVESETGEKRKYRVKDGDIVEIATEVVIDADDNYRAVTKIIKYRNDKGRPNAKFVADSAWSLIQDPISEDSLLSNNLTLVFKHQGNIKRELFRKNAAMTLLDIGSGKGGDLGRFAPYFDKIYCVEPDKRNFEELIRRKILRGTDDSKIELLQYGIEDVSKIIKKFDVDIKVISFMLTLSFCMEHRDSMLRLIKHYKPHKILFYTQDGEALSQALDLNNGKLTILNARFERIDDKRVNAHIEDTIVDSYRERLVDLEDLKSMFPEYSLQMSLGSNYDRFLSSEQQRFQRLYTSGVFTRRVVNTGVNSSGNIGTEDLLKSNDTLTKVGNNTYSITTDIDDVPFEIGDDGRWNVIFKDLETPHSGNINSSFIAIARTLLRKSKKSVPAFDYEDLPNPDEYRFNEENMNAIAKAFKVKFEISDTYKPSTSKNLVFKVTNQRYVIGEKSRSYPTLEVYLAQ